MTGPSRNKVFLSRVVLSAGIILCTATGCMPALRGQLAPHEMSDFRAEALALLLSEAHGDDPSRRMNAIEALSEIDSPKARRVIEANIDNGYAGVSFAALMAVGQMRDTTALEQARLRSEDTDPNVRIAALFALHRLGDQRRTSELSQYLLSHKDPRVRANAAVAIGRMEQPQSIKLLRTALRREKKDAVTMQILESLAMLGDAHGVERLKLYGYSAVPDQSALALMCLANAKNSEADDLFRFRLSVADHPEIKLQAARGLGRLGYQDGYDLASRHLYFNSPKNRGPSDPPELQISRVRQLAALALEDIRDPQALAPLKETFYAENQDAATRLAIARAAVKLIDLQTRHTAMREPE
jgi:HEAT repeat protein